MERYPTEIHLGLGRRLNLLVIEIIAAIDKDEHISITSYRV
jgi:hypothetical protein